MVQNDRIKDNHFLSGSFERIKDIKISNRSAQKKIPYSKMRHV